MPLPQEQLKKTIQTQRLPMDGDFWFDALMGTVISTMFFGGLSGLFILKFDLPKQLTIPTVIFWIAFIFIQFYRGQKLDLLENDYTKSTNFNKVRECLRALSWDFGTHQGTIYLGSNKYWLKWMHVRIIPFEKGIYYNFQYHSASQAGRLPFFIGIRTFMKRKFERQLFAMMLDKTNSI